MTNSRGYYPHARGTLQHRNAFLTNFDKRSLPDDKIVWSEKSAFLSFFAPAEPSPLDADGRSMYP